MRQTRRWVRRSTSALVGGGLALSAFGLAGGPDPRPRRRRPLRPAITGARVINGTRAGPPSRTGTGSLPRLATLGRPVCFRGLRTLGPSVAVGATAAGSTAVGARGEPDVEPDCQRVGILEQRDMDSGLTRRLKVAGY